MSDDPKGYDRFSDGMVFIAGDEVIYDGEAEYQKKFFDDKGKPRKTTTTDKIREILKRPASRK